MFAACFAGILVSVIQHLVELNLLIASARVSSDGTFFLDGDFPFCLSALTPHPQAGYGRVALKPCRMMHMAPTGVPLGHLKLPLAP